MADVKKNFDIVVNVKSQVAACSHAVRAGVEFRYLNT